MAVGCRRVLECAEALMNILAPGVDGLLANAPTVWAISGTLPGAASLEDWHKYLDEKHGG